MEHIGIDPVAQSEAEIGFVKMHKRKIESKWTMDSTNCLAMQLLRHTHLLYKYKTGWSHTSAGMDAYIYMWSTRVDFWF